MTKEEAVKPEVKAEAKPEEGKPEPPAKGEGEAKK